LRDCSHRPADETPEILARVGARSDVTSQTYASCGDKLVEHSCTPR
jgi:hypothetical protein